MIYKVHYVTADSAKQINYKLATDWYFILHSTKAIYCTSKTEY